MGKSEILSLADTTAEKQRGRPFEKGESGNPNGRPVGSRNKATLAVQALFEGEAEAISRKAIELALAGDITAIRFIIERILPPCRDIAVNIELPNISTVEDTAKAMSAILQAVANGKITPSEASSVANLIEQQRKNIETVILGKKLETLETVIKAKG